MDLTMQPVIKTRPKTKEDTSVSYNLMVIPKYN